MLMVVMSRMIVICDVDDEKDDEEDCDVDGDDEEDDCDTDADGNEEEDDCDA